MYLFTAIGFGPGGSGRYVCTKIGKRQHKRRNNTHNNTKTQDTQYRTQKYRTKKSIKEYQNMY
jgi:hypothetical protein